MIITDHFQLVSTIGDTQLETVRQRMRNLKGVFSVQTDDTGTRIAIDHTSTLNRRALAGELARLGYAAVSN